MRGGQNVRLRRRLEALQRAAEAGNQQAAGEAQLLADWLADADAISTKRADDHAKIIGGVWLVQQIKAGRIDPHDLLRELSELLQGSHRKKIVGEDGKGSPAFWRVYGGSLR